MFNLKKPLELPPQLEWKFAHEPELLSWTIRARNYNTFVANGMFVAVALLLVVVSYAVYSVYEGMGQPWRTLSCVFFGVLMLSVTSSMTHQRMKFAFRFTKTGVECCEWKEFPERALTFLKWLAGITAVIFVFMAAVDPSFLIGALIGPGGLGLTYLSMACSKSYREMHTQYHHLIYEWKDFTQLAVATNREVVNLKFTHFDRRLVRVVSWSLNIFCKRKQKHNLAEFIKPFLSPEVPIIEAKVNVPFSTD